MQYNRRRKNTGFLAHLQYITQFVVFAYSCTHVHIFMLHNRTELLKYNISYLHLTRNVCDNWVMWEKYHFMVLAATLPFTSGTHPRSLSTVLTLMVFLVIF